MSQILAMIYLHQIRDDFGNNIFATYRNDSVDNDQFSTICTDNSGNNLFGSKITTYFGLF